MRGLCQQVLLIPRVGSSFPERVANFALEKNLSTCEAGEG